MEDNLAPTKTIAEILVGIVGTIVLIGGILVVGMFVVNAMSKRTEPATFPSMANAIGVIKQAKEDCESKGGVLKREHSGRARREVQVLHEAESKYGSVRAKFDGCLSTIRAGIETGFDDESLAALKLRMDQAGAEYEDFVKWFSKHIRPTKGRGAGEVEGGAGLLSDEAIKKLLEFLQKYYADVQELDKERKKNLLDEIKTCEFHPWSSL